MNIRELVSTIGEIEGGQVGEGLKVFGEPLDLLTVALDHTREG